MRNFKKILKVAAVIAAIAAAVAGVYLLVKKLKAKKEPAADDVESFVSCSCLEDEPIVVEDQPAE